MSDQQNFGRGSFLPQYASQVIMQWAKGAPPAKVLDIHAGHDPAEYFKKHGMHTRLVSAFLREGSHVILPANGEIYRDNDNRAPTAEEMFSFSWGLPSPVTCFQYEWTKGKSAEQYPKRIAICIDWKQLAGSFPRRAESAKKLASRLPGMRAKDGIELQMIFYDPANKRWFLWPIALYMERNEKQIYIEPVASPAGQKTWGMRDCGLWSPITQRGINPDHKSSKQLFTDFLDEIQACVQACHALRAGAILDPLKRSPSSRLRKMKKHKCDGMSYWVLRVRGQESEQRGSSGGHASPRLHLRRAHIRRLSEGRYTLVRQCLVGNPDAGRVEKSYEIEKKGKATL